MSPSKEINFESSIEVSDDFEDIADAFTGTDTTYSAKGYTSDYPTYLVLGAEYDVLPSVDLYFNYRQYFNEEYQFSTAPRFSFATQLEPASWFPIRMGVAVGGFEKFQASVGFGLHSSHYHFDVGITQTGGFFNSARGIGFAIGQKILF